MLLPLNLPADQAVNTEYPPASGIAKYTGTLDLSISPDTMKYVNAKSTVTITGEFSSALFIEYTFGSTLIGLCGSVYIFCLNANNGNAFE